MPKFKESGHPEPSKLGLLKIKTKIIVIVSIFFHIEPLSFIFQHNSSLRL